MWLGLNRACYMTEAFIRIIFGFDGHPAVMIILVSAITIDWRNLMSCLHTRDKSQILCRRLDIGVILLSLSFCPHLWTHCMSIAQVEGRRYSATVTIFWCDLLTDCPPFADQEAGFLADRRSASSSIRCSVVHPQQLVGLLIEGGWIG